MKKYIFCIIIALTSVWSYGQDKQPMWKAELGPVETSGWYRIVLSPEAIAKLRLADQGNFRIHDPEGGEVPYLLRSESPTETATEIQWLRRIRQQYHERWYSRTYFENTSGKPLDHLLLKVRNADVRRRFWLSGSDDLQDWYIIKEDYEYTDIFDSNSTHDLVSIHFPLSNYKYFKVEVRHHWREPIRIEGAGYYDYSSSEGIYQEVPQPEFSQYDSVEKKTSTVHFELDENHRIDRMLFEIDGPERYHRQSFLYHQLATEPGKPPKFDFEENLILDSRRVPQLEYQHRRGQYFKLEIQNEDNLPLQVKGIRIFQLRQYAIAELEAGKTYHLTIYGKRMPEPSYDLVHFQDEIPENQLDLELGALTPIGQNPPAAPPNAEVREEEKDAPLGKGWLWAGVIGIVALLSLLTAKLLRDL